MKVFRRLDEGISPEVEMLRALASRGFAHTPPLLGQLTLNRGRKKPPMTLALLQAYVPNQGDAWSYTLDELRRFFERAMAQRDQQPADADTSLLDLDEAALLPAVRDVIGAYLDTARLLGQRTA